MIIKGNIIRKKDDGNRISFLIGQDWLSTFRNDNNKDLTDTLEFLKEGSFVQFECFKNTKGFINITGIVPYTPAPKETGEKGETEKEASQVPEKREEKFDFPNVQRLIVAQSTLGHAIAAVASVDKMDMSQEEQLTLINKIWGEYFQEVFHKGEEK